MEVGFKSDKGIRRNNNEDACFVLLPDKVYIVADGVGGGNCGEVASNTAVNEIANFIMQHPIHEAHNKYEIVNYLQNCLDHINEKIYQLSLNFEQHRGMATTLIITYVREGKVYISNVGDSRAYLYRDGYLVQLTEDHTYVNTLVKAGILSKEQAENDERKNVITRAIGADERVEADFFQISIQRNDQFLICTDGLYTEVSDNEIIDILSQNLSTDDVCEELIQRANQNGGHDNITVISLRVTEEDVDEY